jgi:hypothetical protein
VDEVDDDDVDDDDAVVEMSMGEETVRLLDTLHLELRDHDAQELSTV